MPQAAVIEPALVMGVLRILVHHTVRTHLRTSVPNDLYSLVDRKCNLGVLADCCLQQASNAWPQAQVNE